MALSRCTVNNASPVNLSSPMVDCKYVLSRRRLEKLLSTSQDVTGSVQNIFNSVAMLGKISSLQLFKACTGVEGRSLAHQLLNLFFHNCSSTVRLEGEGKSLLYSSITCCRLSSLFAERNRTEGTRHKPNEAVFACSVNCSCNCEARWSRNGMVKTR